MKTPQIVIAAVAGLLLLGGGFAAGMTVGRNTETAGATASPSGAAGRFGQGGAGGAGRGVVGGQGANGGQQLLTGRVLSVNDGSITVEVRQGGGANGASPTVTSEIVLVGATTRIVKTTESDIKLSDLKPNDQIQIVGTSDSTGGNVSASAIVIGGNALGGLFGGGGPGGAGGGRGASPSPSPTR